MDVSNGESSLLKDKQSLFLVRHTFLFYLFHHASKRDDVNRVVHFDSLRKDFAPATWTVKAFAGTAVYVYAVPATTQTDRMNGAKGLLRNAQHFFIQH